jgi:hypothetical protein
VERREDAVEQQRALYERRGVLEAERASHPPGANPFFFASLRCSFPLSKKKKKSTSFDKNILDP